MKIKNILAGLAFLLMGTSAYSQGLENIIVEKYYVSNAADAAAANADLTSAGYPTGTLPVGSVTFRVYADLLPGWGIQSVYGIPSHPLVLTTSTNFYNHTNGNTTGGNFSSSSAAIIGSGTTFLDSYLSCGAIAPARFGVRKAEDAIAGGANLVFNPVTVLANNDPSAAPAITTADGMYNTAGVPSLLSLTLLGDAASPLVNMFTDGSVVGNNYTSTNTSWGVLGEQVGAFPAGTNRVLLGQFTSDGVFHFELNVQIRNNTTFAIQNYVSSNPTGAEILMSSLSGTFNVANINPTISITNPLNGASFFVGDAVTIDATAGDADGSVASVEFFVNGASIGVDNAVPFTTTWTATSGNKALTAKVTDNVGAQTTSAAVNITVGVNVAPTVSLTAPANAANVVGGTAVNIDANAADSDGSVANVEFFVDGVSVGVVTTSPYSVSWTSGAPFGNRVITAIATDNFGAQTTSASRTVFVLNPAGAPYLIGNIVSTCVPSNFCLPIKASTLSPVSNVIGYDIVLDYDVTKVTPTGAIVRSNDLLAPTYNYNQVSTAHSIDAVNGKMRIAVYFNSGAPAAARFSGTGEIICVEFAKTSGFLNVDTAIFKADTLLESRITGVQLQPVDSGLFTTYKDSIFNSSLRFWEDNSPIRYNAAVPSDYLITNIYGNSIACNNQSLVAVQPDVNGNFSYNINNGPKLEVIKDIAAATDVQPVVNGFDAFLTRRVLILDASFTPSVYQMIAMDVNMDGVVSSGDLTQINQRAVLFIPEFQQAWNYDANGNPILPVRASRDWSFVDVSTVSSTPAYYISTTYPSNDGIGFSKNKVPVVAFCSNIPVLDYSGCPIIGTESYKGILIGDINGNYSSNNGAPSPFRVGSTDKVSFNLSNAIIANGFVTIPVSFQSTESVNAIDFSLKTNSAKLSFDGVDDLTGKMMIMSHFNTNDQTIRFTSNSMDAIEKNTQVLNIRFAINGNEMTASDLSNLTAYLNGEHVQLDVNTERTLSAEKLNVSVYPNPVNSMLNVLTSENAQIELSDMSGRVVLAVANVLAGEKLEMDVKTLSNGVYMLKVWNGGFISTSKVVVKH